MERGPGQDPVGQRPSEPRCPATHGPERHAKGCLQGLLARQVQASRLGRRLPVPPARIVLKCDYPGATGSSNEKESRSDLAGKGCQRAVSWSTSSITPPWLPSSSSASQAGQITQQNRIWNVLDVAVWACASAWTSTFGSRRVLGHLPVPRCSGLRGPDAREEPARR